MSTFRRIERAFAVVGVAATAAAGVGAYALYSFQKVPSIIRPLPDVRRWVRTWDPSRRIALGGKDSVRRSSRRNSFSISTSTAGFGISGRGIRPWEAFLSGGEAQAISIRTVVKTIESAATDPRVKGFVTTGCHGVRGLATIQELRRAVCKFNEKGAGRSVFHTETFGEADNTTLVYYLASAYQRIFMQPTGLLSAVGFCQSTPFFKGLLDRWGVQLRVWAREEFKTAFHLFTHDDLTDAHRQQLQWVLDGVFGQVTEAISASRGMTQAQVEDVIHRAPLTASQARDCGFIDRILYRDEVWKLFRDPPLPVVSFRDFAKEVAKAEQGSKKPGEVVVLNLKGPIVRGWRPASMQVPCIYSGKVAEQLQTLGKKETVKALVIRVDSPGGGSVASETIRREIAKVRELGKFVVVSMGNVAASGGYYISLGADHVLAEAGTLTGSIGVVMSSPLLKQAAESCGLVVRTLKSAENADLLHPFVDVTPDQEILIQSLLDSIYDDFIQKVAVARGKEETFVQSKAKGRIWLGVDAAEHGLIDEIGGLNEAIEKAKSGAHLASDARVVEFPVSHGLIEILKSLLHPFTLQMPFLSPAPSVDLYSFEAESLKQALGK